MGAAPASTQLRHGCADRDGAQSFIRRLHQGAAAMNEKAASRRLF